MANQSRRGLQVESLAAWPFMVARAFGAPVELVIRNGCTEVAGPIADATAALLVPVTGLILATLGMWSWRHLRPAGIYEAGAHSLTIIMALLLCSRVLSPQFIVWPLGLCGLMLKVRAVPRPLVACLLGSALLAQVLYPHAYLDFLDGGPIGLVIQSARLVLLVSAAWFSWRAILGLAQARGPVPRHIAEPSAPSN